ncbi:MAG TPA: ABC transporter permease [Propionibacteriaceae bacterium]|nr:ABC transporter permease [Propionibacteriaceae bacterium]HQE31135.1 ABC transporter permease [Propionibacteriaceae bacterium]
MGRYLLRRLLNYVVLLFIAVSLAWLLAQTQLHPRMLFELRNPPLDPNAVESLLRSANVNENVPLLDRYLNWLYRGWPRADGSITGGIFRWTQEGFFGIPGFAFDWGTSVQGGGSVNEEISRRIWVSFRLVTAGWILGTIIGVGLGAWTATRQYRISDRVVTAFALLLVATPSYVTGEVAKMLATWANQKLGFQFFLFLGERSTGTLPDYPFAELIDRLQHMLIPTIVLTLLGMAGLSRLQRGLMLDALHSDFVRTARAKGLRENKAVMKHALRTALIPTGTYFAFQAAALFTGATFTERIFSFHGMGMYGVDTISKQDINGVVAVTAFGGLCYLVGAMLADVMVAILDPRVRLS